MEITEVRVALREADQRLKAYATVTFDHCFVVRNIKIIEGKHGLFVAMPSHKTRVACGQCHWKNEFGGRFCTQCGAPLSRPLEGPSALWGEGGEMQAHRDIAHPITMEFRQCLQQKILEAYEAERTKGHSGSMEQSKSEHEAF